MKNFTKLFISTALCLAFFSYHSYSLQIGVNIGLSTPNNELNNIYNSSSIQNVGNFVRQGTKLGYHVGIRGRLNLSDNLMFVGGIAYHKFPQTSISIFNPSSPNDTITLSVTENVIPITAGVNYYIIKQFIGLYGVGELSYNYISSSVDAQYGSIPVQLSKSPTDSRIGFGIGAGMDLDVKLVTLNLEAKYNMINLIGQKAGEQSKAFVSVALGVFF